MISLDPRWTRNHNVPLKFYLLIFEVPIRFHCFLFSIVIYESDTIIVSCFPVAKDLIYSLFKITPPHNFTILVEIFLCWPSILKLFLCGCHLGIYLCRYFFNWKIFLYSIADVTSIPNIFRDTSALVLPSPPPILLASLCTLGGLKEVNIGVRMRWFKYHFILRVLFSCFKSPSGLLRFVRWVV